MLKQNANIIRKAIVKANSALERFSVNAQTREQISGRMEQLMEAFSNDGSGSAIGIFVSSTQHATVVFPFPVNEGVFVSGSFQTRDVRRLEQFLKPYYVVGLGKDFIHLYQGSGQSLTEVRNTSFPVTYKDDYEYAPASLGSSHGYALKGFEKDKGDLLQKRQHVYVHHAANKLAALVRDQNAEIVVVGPPRMVTDFMQTYPAGNQIAGHINSTFNGRNFQSLSAAAWEEVSRARAKEVDAVIARVNDLPLNSKAEGLREVWQAARSGSGSLLLVEKDFQRSAYRLKGREEIRLHPPAGNYEVIADAVDDVIECVMEKHGRVVFTERNQLGQYDGIVLMRRY